MRFRVKKDLLDKAINSIYWSVGTYNGTDDPIHLSLYTGSNELRLSAFSDDGRYFHAKIPCETKSTGGVRVPFYQVRGVLNPAQSMYIIFEFKEKSWLSVKTRDSEAKLPCVSGGLKEIDPPAEWHIEILSGTLNKMSMHLDAIEGDGVKVNFYPMKNKEHIWMESEGALAHCLCKLKSFLPLPSIDNYLSIPASNFCYSMRGLTNFGFGKVLMTFFEGSIWVASPVACFKIPYTMSKDLSVSKTMTSVTESNPNPIEISMPRSALIKALECCLFANPMDQKVQGRVAETRESMVFVLYTKGDYLLRKAINASGPEVDPFSLNGRQLLGFLKTIMDAVVRIKVGESHLFIDHADNTRFAQCLHLTR